MNTPRFDFKVSKAIISKNGYMITLNNEEIHRISDVDEFYKALGYTDEVMCTGLLPDEFLWFAYHKDNSKKCEVNLQLKIVVYLIKQSAIFKEKYATQYEYWLGKCTNQTLRETTGCISCDKR